MSDEPQSAAPVGARCGWGTLWIGAGLDWPDLSGNALDNQ